VYLASSSMSTDEISLLILCSLLWLLLLLSIETDVVCNFTVDDDIMLQLNLLFRLIRDVAAVVCKLLIITTAGEREEHEIALGDDEKNDDDDDDDNSTDKLVLLDIESGTPNFLRL
jgi:hypothetical protein